MVVNINTADNAGSISSITAVKSIYMGLKETEGLKMLTAVGTEIDHIIVSF